MCVCREAGRQGNEHAGNAAAFAGSAAGPVDARRDGAALADHFGRPAGHGSSGAVKFRPDLAGVVDRVWSVQADGARGVDERMRRASLLAPLLLIGLGALFLARNVYPDLRLLDYLAKYWPFLLILWGVLRLGEILYWGATRQPFPRSGISGGEWGLVVLLCFLGVTL